VRASVEHCTRDGHSYRSEPHGCSSGGKRSTNEYLRMILNDADNCLDYIGYKRYMKVYAALIRGRDEESSQQDRKTNPDVQLVGSRLLL
jgi:hypothetical protein